MNARQLVIFLVVAALAAPLLKKLWEASQTKADTDLPKVDRSQVVEYIEKTLQDHAGEETPLVQAFESALELESRHGEPSRA